MRSRGADLITPEKVAAAYSVPATAVHVINPQAVQNPEKYDSLAFNFYATVNGRCCAVL